MLPGIISFGDRKFLKSIPVALTFTLGRHIVLTSNRYVEGVSFRLCEIFVTYFFTVTITIILKFNFLYK